MNVKGHGSLTFFDWNNSHVPEILHEIYIQKIYHPYLVGKTNAVFLDIGFNIGLWSLYASQYAKTVYGFEPTAQSCEIGQENLKNNGVTNVTLFHKAVGIKDGKSTFYYSTNSTQNSFKEIVNDSKKSEEVDTIRLDTFVKEEKIDKIDFAKIDIEGYEDILFSSESFRLVSPVLDCFIYEYHQWANASPTVINAGLSHLGYVIRQIPSNATLFLARR